MSQAPQAHAHGGSHPCIHQSRPPPPTHPMLVRARAGRRIGPAASPLAAATRRPGRAPLAAPPSPQGHAQPILHRPGRSARGGHPRTSPPAAFPALALSTPTSDWGVWAGLLAAGAAGMWSERTRLGRELSGCVVIAFPVLGAGVD